MPDNKLHLCVGFYPDGSYVCNTVRDEDLKSNIEYNDMNRPGRIYFVDGEYACGGLMEQYTKDAFIEKCKERMKELGLKPAASDTHPYI